MSQERATQLSPASAREEGPRTAGSGPTYRSVADGELLTTWTMSEYFASLNTVMRLPSKVRRRALEGAKETKGGEAALAVARRIPIGLVVAAALVAIAVLVGRPLRAAVGDSVDLRAANGVWQAGKGRYEGRTFQIVGNHIAFGTSSNATEYTWHEVKEVRAKVVADSTLFTVVYDEGGRTAEFAFWYLGGRPAAIHVVNQPGVVWSKTTRSPSVPPNS